VHTEVVVDDVQLVDIDVEGAPIARAALVCHRATNALLESRPRVQAAQRIVTTLDDTDGLAREDVAEARIAVDEILAEVLAEQCEHPDRAPGQ
jgi:hypothetical protein